MNKTKVASVGILSIIVGLTLLLPVGGVAKNDKHSHKSTNTQAQTTPQVIPETHHDTSPPLRDLAAMEAQLPPKSDTVVRVIPLRPGPPPVTRTGSDTVLQNSTSLRPLISTSNLISFDGIAGSLGFIPPDPNTSVGGTQIVETVNASYQVFTKTGASLLGPIDITTIWSGFGGFCQGQGATVRGDPVVVYDKLANRWLITQLAAASDGSPGTECIAVSTSSDATGSFNRYAFSFSLFNDYPKFGVWPDAYYASYNMFSDPTTRVSAEACAYDRTAMLAGNSATEVCFQGPLGLGDFSLLPADLDGSTPPSSGEPNFFLEITNNPNSSLNLYRFHVDFTTPGNSTFTGPMSMSVASFNVPCALTNPPTSNCIPQEGTTQLLDSLGDRLMFRLAYRNFGDHESLVTNHSVVVGNNSSVGVRWYEIRNLTGTPFVFQQGTYAPDSTNRWMGSIAMDKFGNTALGYSLSSTTMFPSIAFTGQGPGDSLGTMEAESVIQSGGGAQSGGSTPNRWGDYTSMAIDPTDDSMFFYTNEYYHSTDPLHWSTRITAFKLAENFSVLVVPCAQTVTPGNGFNYTTTVSVSNGIRNTVTLSASGLPTGASANFNPTSITGPGTSIMSVTTSPSTPTGSSTVSVTGNSGITTQSASTILTVAGSGSPGTGTVTIGGFEKSFCPPSCGRFCSRSCATYDDGQVTIIVGTANWSAGYLQGSTSASVARALAALFNGDCNSPVNATVTGSTITFTARAFGASTNYSMSASSYSLDPHDFNPPSFSATPSGPTLTGGSN
jgi:hypothetical protein